MSKNIVEPAIRYDTIRQSKNEECLLGNDEL